MLAKPLSTVAVAGAAVVLLAVGGAHRFRDAQGPDLGQLSGDPLARGVANWDAAWYVGIATSGYWYRAGEQSPVAFFPGYPMAVRAVAAAGLNAWAGASLLSLCCGLLAVTLFRSWAKAVAPQHASDATGFLALYPFAFYLFGVIYADAFFLLFAVGAFLSLEKDRPWLAGLLGLVATLSRPAAPAVVVGLLLRGVELRRQRGQALGPAVLAPGLAALGLLGYMLFLQLEFDDALAFAHVQAAPGWDNAPGLHTWLKREWFRILFPTSSAWVAVRLGGHAAVTLLALALVVPTFRRLGLGYGAYVAIAVGLPALSSHDFQGLGRYVIAAFPLFVTGASLLAQRHRWRRWVLVASAALFAALAIGFGAGGYIA